MCSRKYSKVPDSTECHTKLLTLKNTCFFHDQCKLRHSDPNLHLADSISITFEYYLKNDEQDGTITMHWLDRQQLTLPCHHVGFHCQLHLQPSRHHQ